MRVTSSNQTLILASERRGFGEQPGESTPPSGGSGVRVLQRVTIVASRPAEVLYLRAEYSQDNDAGGTGLPLDDGGSLVRLSGPTRSGRRADDADSGGGNWVSQSNLGAASRDEYGNPAPPGRDTALTSYLKPAEQYARTQLILAQSAHVPHIDVHA